VQVFESLSATKISDETETIMFKLLNSIKDIIVDGHELLNVHQNASKRYRLFSKIKIDLSNFAKENNLSDGVSVNITGVPLFSSTLPQFDTTQFPVFHTLSFEEFDVYNVLAQGLNPGGALEQNLDLFVAAIGYFQKSEGDVYIVLKQIYQGVLSTLENIISLASMVDKYSTSMTDKLNSGWQPPLRPVVSSASHIATETLSNGLIKSHSSLALDSSSDPFLQMTDNINSNTNSTGFTFEPISTPQDSQILGKELLKRKQSLNSLKKFAITSRNVFSEAGLTSMSRSSLCLSLITCAFIGLILI